MAFEAFNVETFSGAARRPSQRLLASAAACKKQWVIAPIEINMVFLQGLTYQELAEATGENDGVEWFTLQPGPASVLRSLPGFEHCDESKHCLQCFKPGTGTKDAPRASSLKLRKTTRGFGLRPTSHVEEFETSNNLLTAKHVDDANMANTGGHHRQGSRRPVRRISSIDRSMTPTGEVDLRSDSAIDA
eukprot:1937740-Pyramimonas_sp.AAC.1